MKGPTSCLAGFTLVALSGVGCGSPAPSRDTSVPGYEHELTRSTFRIGEFLGVRSTAWLDAVYGTLGSFAVQRATRAATGMPNFDVPVPGDVFPGDDAAQNAAARAYFVGAGIPADQILRISANQTGIIRIESVPEGGRLGPKPPEVSLGASSLVVARYSILHRGFEGVEIVDSIAFTIFGKEGNSLYEQVYWPTLDASLVEELDAFRAMLAQAAEREKYLARLPGGIQAGELMIRHTAWYYEGPFVARAAYRATFSGGTFLYFDIRGQLLTLPDEEELRNLPVEATPRN